MSEQHQDSPAQPSPSELAKASEITERWAKLDWIYTRVAMPILVGSALVTFSKDRFTKLWPADTTYDYALNAASLVLLITVVGLVFRWVGAVGGEMSMLRAYFRDYIQPHRGQIYLWTVLFSLLFGTLGALTENITAFSALFAVYSLGDMWGCYIRDSQLKPAFESSKAAAVDDALRRKRDAIKHSYIDRPHMQRSATIMFVSFVALCTCLIANNPSSGLNAESLRIAAYSIVIANIIVSEIIISRWRKARDDVLEEAHSW